MADGLSFNSVGRTELFDFEIQDTQDRSWDAILRMAELKAKEFVDEHEGRIDNYKFKLDTVEVECGYETSRNYKFVLEMKIWLDLG
jgi:hypothetical protein